MTARSHCAHLHESLRFARPFQKCRVHLAAVAYRAYGSAARNATHSTPTVWRELFVDSARAYDVIPKTTTQRARRPFKCADTDTGERIDLGTRKPQLRSGRFFAQESFFNGCKLKGLPVVRARLDRAMSSLSLHPVIHGVLGLCQGQSWM